MKIIDRNTVFIVRFFVLLVRKTASIVPILVFIVRISVSVNDDNVQCSIKKSNASIS